MATIDSVTPHFSASRDGGEQVTITGTGLEAVTSVSFGPFDGTIVDRAADRLTVHAPGYQPGHGGQHGEVIVWVDTEPTRSGVIWTWAGKTLEELGGPLDEADQALAFGMVPAPAADPADPIDAALRPATPAEPAAGAKPLYAEVVGFEPATVPRAGGWITVHGQRFTGATAVSIGSLPCPDFEVRSDESLVAFVPRFPGGHNDRPPFPIVWHGEQASVSPPDAPMLFWDAGNDVGFSFATEDDTTPPA